MNILIIPIGEVDPDTLGSLRRSLQETYHSEIALGESLLVQQSAYSKRREQYHATRILKALEAHKPAACDCLLGVIDEDLYVLEFNFVFGEADLLKKIAVIGLPRLRQEYYGLKPDKELFLRRAAKEAVHEIGHIYGLGHCPDHRCIMHFSNSLKDTDVKESRFCDTCRNQLRTGSS